MIAMSQYVIVEIERSPEEVRARFQLARQERQKPQVINPVKPVKPVGGFFSKIFNRKPIPATPKATTLEKKPIVAAKVTDMRGNY